MGSGGCLESMELLNQVFQSGIIENDGHEIFARLNAGEDVVDLVGDYGKKFGKGKVARRIQEAVQDWPPLHREAVTKMVAWALSKLDTDDRVMISWKGNADHPETVTRFELRDHTLLIEFAHPPGGFSAAQAGA